MSNLEKERKHIDYLKNQIREGVKPEQASLLLQTIYDFSCLQKFKIDNKEEIIDVEDIAEYQYEQWSSKINNRDDFVFVVYQSLKLYSQIDQGIKRHSLKITDGIKEVLRQIEKLIKDSCYNHLDFYERECPKSKIGKKLKGESEESIKKICNDNEIRRKERERKTREEPAKETLEQQGENLLYAYQNQARQELDKIDVVFAGSLYDVDGEEGKEPLKDAKGNLVKNLKGEPIMVDKNQVILYSEFSERIENEKNIEKVKMIVEEALIFSCNITKKLLDKNFFDQSTLYKYLKCLPRNIRNELFFNNFNEWDGYPELIGEKLSKEQIQELFFSKEKVKLVKPSKKWLIDEVKTLEKQIIKRDELLARLGNEVIPHLQNEVNLFSSQVYSLKRSSELWQKMIADLKSKNGSLKDEKQELIDELAIWQTELEKQIKIKEARLLVLKKMSELTPFDWVEISASDLALTLKDWGIDIKELDTDIEYWQEIILSFQENDQHHLDNQAKLNKQIRNSLQVIDEHKVQILTLISNREQDRVDQLLLREVLIKEEEKLRDENWSLYSYNQLLQQSLRRAISKIIYWKKATQNRDNFLKQFRTDKIKLLKELQEAKWENEDNQDFIGELNSYIDNKEEELEQTEEEINKLRSHYEERLNKLKEEIIKLGIENNNLDTQSQELKENKNNVIIQQWQELNQAKTEIEKWTKKYQQEHKRFINHDAQLAKETKKYEKLKKKYQARGEKIRSLESLEQEIKELKDQQNKTKKQKDKVKTRLGEQVKNLKKLAKSKTDMKEDHQNQMTSLKIRLESEISVLKSDNSQLEYDLKVRTKQRDKARQKLRVIKHNKKKLKEKAQDRGVCMSLIKWEDISQRYLEDNDNSLAEALDDTQHNLVDAIIETQEYLGIDNLVELETTHKMPKDKTLKDLIEFYNDPPTTPPPTILILKFPKKSLLKWKFQQNQ